MSDVVESLQDFREWSKLTAQAVDAAADQLASCVGAGFQWSGVVPCPNGVSLASFCHQATGMVFHLIPGGTDWLGLSDPEYEVVKGWPEADLELLSAVRPAEKVEVEPFLLSRLPLLEETVLPVVEVDWSLFRPDFRPLSGEKTGQVPVYLTRSETESVLGRYGFSLPTEAQWEYAVRGGTDTPFYFGTELPEDTRLAEIFTTDFRTIPPSATNPFGIAGMLSGGWCQDTLQESRWHGTSTGAPYVVRGGAAIYWPWQSCGEWMLALSAMRRSSDDLEDETCSAHATAPVTL